MAKFRKKPVVIEAMQWTGENVDDVLAFMAPGGWVGGRGEIEVETIEGIMTAKTGDWIIKGVKGEFYPCKPDIFAATYEPA